MIRSMTGFSRVQVEEGDLSLSVGIRSINHRFLDMQVRLPSILDPLESFLRNLVKEHLARGHVEVMVSLERQGRAELKLDKNLLGAYVAAYRTLRGEFGSCSEPDLISLLRTPGIVVASNGELSTEDLGRIREVLERVTREALNRLNEMRAREGESLERDLDSRLKRLKELSEGIVKLSARVPHFYQQRLESRIREMLGNVEVDPGRVAQEVAYLASRSDISEELTRFKSHLDQAKRLLAESSEVGKKLDFLLQEMNREANTLLSKTTDVPEVGPDISRAAIEMKTEIEKLREQAQNIE